MGVSLSGSAWVRHLAVKQNKRLAVKIQGGKDLATLQAPLELVRAMRVTPQLEEKQADQHQWGMPGLGVRQV